MTGIKYNFAPPAPTSRTSPDLVPVSRPFDLDQQMRLFIAEKRTASLHNQQQSSSPSIHSRTPLLNKDKSLPTLPGPLPSLLPRDKKLVKLSRKPSKAKLQSISSPATKAISAMVNYNQPTRTSSTSAPSPSRFRMMMEPWQQRRRPASFIDQETPASVGDRFLSPDTPEFAIPPQPRASPESSPLLPSPRGNKTLSRRGTDLRIILPSTKQAVIVSAAPRPQTTRVSTSPVKRRGQKHHRARASGVLESVLGIHSGSKPRSPPTKSTVEVVTDHFAQGTMSKRITNNSQTQPPRTPPPPPTPAKSQAQRERARMQSPLSLTAPLTPVGFVAELEGCFPVANAESNASGTKSVMPTPTVVMNNKPRRKKVKPSNIKSVSSPSDSEMPEGKELYARLPLPAVPTPSQSRLSSPVPNPTPKSSEISPVIDIELEMGDTDGLIEWFENFHWGKVLSSNPPQKTLGTTITPTSKRTSRGSKTNSSNTLMLPFSRAPQTPQSDKITFSIEDRASVLDPSGAVRNGEPSLLPARSNSMVDNSGLLSPVYPLSPRLLSYYGARSSIASSVGDAFRFDLEMGEELSDVDEEHEEHEVDIDELCQLSPTRDDTEKLDEQAFDGREENKQLESQKIQPLESYELNIDEFYGDEEYDDDDNSSDTSSEFGSRLEQEIEMILSGTYGGGSPDDWRDDIYSAGSSSSEQTDEWEGDITVGLDIEVGVQKMGKAEEGVVGINSAIGDREWRERPRTRYIAGRNSMLDNDVIFCLRGVDSM